MISDQKISERTPRTFAGVGGTPCVAVEALAQRVQRAGADVAVDDAEGAEGEATGTRVSRWGWKGLDGSGTGGKDYHTPRAGPLQERAWSGGLAADLHEAHQVAVVALGEHVLGPLLLEDAEDLGLEGGVRVGGVEQGAERVGPAGEEAEAELAAGGQAQAVAVGAEGVGERGDEADGTHRPGSGTAFAGPVPAPVSTGVSGPKRASSGAGVVRGDQLARLELGWCRSASSR